MKKYLKEEKNLNKSIISKDKGNLLNINNNNKYSYFGYGFII
jgi:hypothetical protein